MFPPLCQRIKVRKELIDKVWQIKNKPKFPWNRLDSTTWRWSSKAIYHWNSLHWLETNIKWWRTRLFTYFWPIIHTFIWITTWLQFIESSFDTWHGYGRRSELSVTMFFFCSIFSDFLHFLLICNEIFVYFLNSFQSTCWDGSFSRARLLIAIRTEITDNMEITNENNGK